MARPLHLLSLAAVPAEGLQHYRVSTAGPVAATVLVGVWVLACAWVAWSGGIGKVIISPALAGWASFWIGLYWLYVANDLRKALKPEAWIAALGPDGVYVNFRSYRNIGLGEAGPQVVLLPYSLIAVARGELSEAAAAHSVEAASRFVELELRDADTSALEQSLAEERDGRPGGVPLTRILWRESPVSFEPGFVRIDWRARPGVAVFLFELGRRGATVAQSVHRGLAGQPRAR
jgi:hypothetical protein